MKRLYEALLKHPVVYVTRDIERALGIYPGTPGYHIVSNKTALGVQLQSRHPEHILLIDTEHPLDTHELLERTEVKMLFEKTKASLVVFKNTPHIERIAQEHKITLLNPPAKLAARVEEKISQIAWLEELCSFLPPHTLTTVQELSYEKKPYIIQFNHAHSGEGTKLIKRKSDLALLKERFPLREVRKTDFIEGPIFTNNNIVTETAIIRGNISYQITGLSPFTDLPFSTIGNDWGLPKILLSKEQRMRYAEIAEAIGEKLRADGWRGLFGIDVVQDAKTGKLYLLEINARQAASASFESELQKEASPQGLSVCEAHLSALLTLPPEGELTEIRTGAQIVQRITNQWRELCPEQKTNRLEMAGFHVISYPNNALNSEVLRIQSRQSLLKGHGELGEVGHKIVSLLPQQFFSEKTLGTMAMKVEKAYLSLPLGNGVQCPYFNNRHHKVRIFALPAFVGKGSPEAICEEADILFKRKHIDPAKLTSDTLRSFLIENNLGVDCSGFAYHLLSATVEEAGLGALRRKLYFATSRPLIGQLIGKLRPSLNAGVTTFSHHRNSTVVPLSSIRPGDFIAVLGSHEGARNHMMVLTHIYYEDGAPRRFSYSHAIAWPSDGTARHGVRKGEIHILDLTKPLLDQHWIEQGQSGEQNGTWVKAKKAQEVTIRRLHLLHESQLN